MARNQPKNCEKEKDAPEKSAEGNAPKVVKLKPTTKNDLIDLLESEKLIVQKLENKIQKFKEDPEKEENLKLNLEKEKQKKKIRMLRDQIEDGKISKKCKSEQVLVCQM